MKKKEFIVGEKFQFGLKILKCVKGKGCDKCCFRNVHLSCSLLEEFIGECAESKRTDATDVVFVEVKRKTNGKK